MPTMKFRQVEDANPQPVDKAQLKAGDYVEDIGYPYVVRPQMAEYFALNLATGYSANLCGPLYRIHNLHQQSDGTWKWDRVQHEPKPVKWDVLQHGELYTTGNGHLFRRYKPGVKGLAFDGNDVHTIGVDSCCTWAGDNTPGDTLYRVDICGFDDSTGEILWRRV